MSAITKSLSHLEHDGLISVAALIPDLQYHFRHALVQNAAYDSLLRQDRRKLHREVASILERTYPDRLDELAAQLAMHYEEADQDQHALVYYTRAAKRAARQYANQEAALYYGSAATIATRIRASTTDLITLYQAWGRMLELSNQHASAFEVYQRLEALAAERGEAHLKLAGLVGQAILCCTPSPLIDVERGMALSQTALDLAQEIGEQAAMARILWARSLGCYFSGQPAKGVEYGEQSLAICRELNLREQLAYTLNDLSRDYAGVGNLRRTIETLNEAAALWRELGNVTMLTDSLNSLGEMQNFTGDYRLMLRTSEESIQLNSVTGNVWGLAHGQWVRSVGLLETGRYGEAIEVGESALSQVRAAGLHMIMSVSLLEISRFYSVFGMVDRSLEAVHESLINLGEAGGIFAPWANVIAAQVYLNQGDIEKARSYLNKVLPQLSPDDLGTPAPIISALVQSRISLFDGKPAEAIHTMEPLLIRLQTQGLWGGVPEMLFLKARAQRELGQSAEALATLREAYGVARGIGAKRVLWPICLDLARFDDAARHDAYLAEARQIVAAILDNLSVRPDVQAAFAMQPEVLAVLEGSH